MIDLSTVTSNLEILQAMRSDAQEAGNRRLATALTVAISELLNIDDRYINGDVWRYQHARRLDPQMRANVKLSEVSRDDDGTIVLAVVPHDC